jgi:hypothetical protein
LWIQAKIVDCYQKQSGLMWNVYMNNTGIFWEFHAGKMCHGFFCVQWVQLHCKMRGDCSFCWYWWNWCPSLFKLSFYNVYDWWIDLCVMLLKKYFSYIVTWTNLQLHVPFQSVPITTYVVSLNPVHGKVYSIKVIIQHHVLKFVSDLRQVDGWKGTCSCKSNYHTITPVNNDPS